MGKTSCLLLYSLLEPEKKVIQKKMKGVVVSHTNFIDKKRKLLMEKEAH